MTGAVVAIGVFLVGQLTLVLIWGAQMEMRMRAVESVARNFDAMRDDVTTMKSDGKYIRRIVEELNTKLDRAMEEDRSFRPRRRSSQDT